MACEQPSIGAAAFLADQMAALVPDIRTQRLLLRAPRIDDFDAYAEIACGPRGVHMGGPMTRAEAWYDFASMTAGWLLRGHGLWTISLLASGECLGFVLLGFEPGDAEPELGFMLCKSAEGQGFAAEAAEAARRYGFEELNLPALASYIAQDNARSIALAERLGAISEAPVSQEDGEEKSLIFRHPRPEVQP
ncbi:MAG: GNAT family N-acetyltransferase [Pseudomonadota bacterium]